MPNSCCVLGCVSNYYYGNFSQAVTVFTFPADSAKREKWVKSVIQRPHFVRSKSEYSLCVKHFKKRYCNSKGFSHQTGRKFQQ